MPYQLTETVLVDFDAAWRPSWTGLNRVFIVADLATDGSQFIGYGTDGETSFRVQGDKVQHLQAFRSLMQSEGAKELTIQYQAQPLNVIITPPSFPDANIVQQSFDDEYGLPAAVAA